MTSAQTKNHGVNRPAGVEPSATGRSARKTRASFTLIELLVVISIIALLISILLPSLRNAREQAKVALCISNLKAIAAAGITYAQTDATEQTIPLHPHTGRLLPADPGAYDWGGKAGRGEPTQGRNSVTSVWGTAYGKGPATRPLNGLLYKAQMADYSRDPGVNQVNWLNDQRLDLPLLRCPSDRGYTGLHFSAWAASRLSSYDHYGTSYVANTFWCSSHSPPCIILSMSPLFRPLTQVPNPANTVYFMDNAGRFAWRVDTDAKLPRCWTNADGPHFARTAVESEIKGWHRRPYHFPMSFIDGHAGMVHMKGHILPEPRQSQYPPHPLVGFGDLDNHEGWRCHIIRGRGWQLDTLPAAAIAVPIECDYSSVGSDLLR